MTINKLYMLLLATGCMISSTGFARYKSQPLKKNSRQVFSNSANSVDCKFKVFTKNDCKDFLNSKSIIKKGFQPVQISISNSSEHDIFVTSDSFGLSTVSAQGVSRCLHRDGVSRGVGFGIGGLFFWWLFIPAVVQGCGARDYNADMDIDFADKSFKEQVIKSGATATGIIFVPSHDFNPNFSVTLKNAVSNESIVIYPYEFR